MGKGAIAQLVQVFLLLKLPVIYRVARFRLRVDVNTTQYYTHMFLVVKQWDIRHSFQSIVNLFYLCNRCDAIVPLLRHQWGISTEIRYYFFGIVRLFLFLPLFRSHASPLFSLFFSFFASSYVPPAPFLQILLFLYFLLPFCFIQLFLFTCYGNLWIIFSVVLS